MSSVAFLRQAAALLLTGAFCVYNAQARTVLRQAAIGELAGAQNRLLDPGFEYGGRPWSAYQAGFRLDDREARSGARSITSVRSQGGSAAGAYQQVLLDQNKPRPIVFSAASKAAGVTGQPDSDYSLWLDFQYTDLSWHFGLSRPFAAGTHDWQLVEGAFLPEKPVRRVILYLLFRGGHQGTVWFDEAGVTELGEDVVWFHGVPIQTADLHPNGCGPSAVAEVRSQDGLRLGFTARGGTVSQLEAAGQNLLHCGSAAVSGFFARDVAANSDFVSLEPAVTAADNQLELDQLDGPLALSFQATVWGRPGGIEIRARIQNRLPQLDRAVTLYFALPVEAQDWIWWDDLRNGQKINRPREFRNTIPVGWGSTGQYSPHLFASLTGRTGLALGYPMDSPAPVQFAYNHALKLFYLAFDLALTKDTAKFPNQAEVRFLLYHHEPEWGFRSALAKYMQIYPAFFEKRAEKEGIWVAFDSLERIPSLEDFGIQFHEVIGRESLPFDTREGISTFRYLSEPWSYWMSMPAELDHSNYDQVTGFLEKQASEGEGADQTSAKAALSSGVFYRGDRLLFWPQAQPWMKYGAVVVNNPNPDIEEGGSSLNKGRLEWNEETQQVYRGETGSARLAGEYIDSFEATGNLLDLRRSHFAASSFPLTFSNDFPPLPGVPQIFSAYEFARRVGQDLHSRFGKLLMANGALNQMAFYAHAFDVLGAEINWAPEGKWTPDSDAAMLFRRMYAGRKPYLLLMNTDFARFSPEMVERYFELALFYAMYPGMFSADAATNTYWTNPALYERDRPLFRRYIPWIRALSKAGWQPITGARASDSRILIERYSEGNGVIFTLRNDGDRKLAFRVEIDSATVGLSEGTAGQRQIILTGALDPGSTQCWQPGPGPR